MARSRFERAVLLFVVIAPFLCTLYGIVLLWNRMVNWRDLVLLFTFYCIGGLGITIGYHRMLVHNSFEPNPFVRFLFLMFGCMAMEGTPQIWACTHMKHHQHSDMEDDPHSPLHGFWHAHFGWLITGNLVDVNRYGKWLQKDPLVMFMSRTFFFWVGLGFLIPYLIGGWSGVFWGGIVRVCLMHHTTWSVNSVCHTFGQRMFHTTDVSRNNWIVGLLAFGEGWHNNHHAFPKSAFHGLRWWQIDVSGYIIRFMELTGLVKNVYRIPQESFNAKLIKPTPAAPVVTTVETETQPAQTSRPSLPLKPRKRRFETGN